MWLGPIRQGCRSHLKELVGATRASFTLLNELSNTESQERDNQDL